MKVSVQSRLHRTLRGLEPFRVCNNWDQLKHLRQISSPLDTGEELLGVYENYPESADGVLVFTNLGIYILELRNWRNLKYKAIAGADWPKESKREAQTLIVRMNDGTCESLPVLRGCLFDIMRFLDRVVADGAK